MERLLTKRHTLYILLDFSEYSKTELLFAKSWIADRDFEVRVLHQLDLLVPTLTSKDMRLKISYGVKRDILNKWFQLKNEIFPDNEHVKFEILDHSIVDYLTKIPKDERIFIIMGLKGGGKLKQIFIGSMVNEVIEKLDIVTFALPKSLKNFTPNEIIITVHPEFDFNIEALHQLLDIVPDTVNTLKWISIAKEGEQVEDLNDYLEYLIKRTNTGLQQEMAVFSGMNVFAQVKSFFQSNENKILLIQKGGRTFMDKLFRKFLINDLVYDGSIPLIILPL
ncbi:universal stress protein [Fontibacter flavus]|uniref:Universal stress protein n=1 Tax=Fontibacter flavus TaxID=654838 RepID=A0ABV6FMJ2_9BACT